METHLRKAVDYERLSAVHAAQDFYVTLGLPKDKIPHCRYITKTRLMDLFERNIVYDRVIDTGCIFYHLERHISVFIPFAGFDEYIGLCCDVFVDGYTVDINRRFILIDIGANLFNASLLFASDPLCDKVFAYEIIPSIYETGLVNLELNPHLKDKIQGFNVGLYNTSKVVEVIYYPTRSGASGISERLSEAEWLKSTRDQDFLAPECVQRSFVQVEEACGAISDHCRQYAEAEVIVKIDAENAEAEIVENLGSLFDRVYCFVVEVHSRAATEKLAAIFKDRTYTRVKQAENIFAYYNDGRKQHRQRLVSWVWGLLLQGGLVAGEWGAVAEAVMFA